MYFKFKIEVKSARSLVKAEVYTKQLVENNSLLAWLLAFGNRNNCILMLKWLERE